MSYLHPPRLHFRGRFISDVSTNNNAQTNYDLDQPLVRVGGAGPGMSNPDGTHRFAFEDCTVTAAVGATGERLTSDPLLGGALESFEGNGSARMAGLDMFAGATFIHGLNIELYLPDEDEPVLSGEFEPTCYRDWWRTRSPQVPGESRMSRPSAIYQSALRGVRWGAGAAGSQILRELQAASENEIAIQFVLYGYRWEDRGGIVQGTLGPLLAGEHPQAQPQREFTLGGGDFGKGTFLVDTKRSCLIVDLGNAVPEGEGNTPLKQNSGLSASIMAIPLSMSAAEVKELVERGGMTGLGDIDYPSPKTADITELPLDSQQLELIQKKAVAVYRSSPAKQMVMSELPGGLRVLAAPRGIALNPGESGTVELLAFRFGQPAGGEALDLLLSMGDFEGLSFPERVVTGGDGRAVVNFAAGDPGQPRGLNDGQIYEVSVYEKTPEPSRVQAKFQVRVFSALQVPENPTWEDVFPVLALYARLYPAMKSRLDLSDEDAIKAYVRRAREWAQDTSRPAAEREDWAHRARLYLDLPATDPRHMPATRDLSRDRRELLLRWVTSLDTSPGLLGGLFGD